MSTPAKLKKLPIYQGATFRKRLRWVSPSGTPVDLTGCTARMQARPEKGSDTVLMDLSTSNGGITLGGTSGYIDLYLNHAATKLMEWESAVHDLEITHPNGDVTRLAEGSIGVSKEVTRG